MLLCLTFYLFLNLATKSQIDGRRMWTVQVNLRQLEERLNMIQEECNRDSDETDDERSATLDERSEK